MGGKSGQQGETAQERAQAQHALDLMQDYKKRWLPVQKRLASTIEQMGEKDSAARRLATGKASTDTAMQFDKAGMQLEKGLSNSGVGPGSSRSNLAIAGMGTDAASATGIGHMMSEQQVDDAYTQSLGALTALGRGERATVGTSLTNMARQSASQAQADAQASLMARSGDAALAGQVVGFGLQQGMSQMGTKNAFNAFDTSGTGMGAGSPWADQQLPTAGGR